MQLRGKPPEERMKYINSLMLKHPRFFRIWAGPFRAMVALYHPETIRDLLKTAGAYCFFLWPEYTL